MGKILIKSAGWVVTMDPERRILTDGAVAIEDDRIVEVGKTNEIVSKFKAEKVIDAQGKLVLPGLIDTHVHTLMMGDEGLRLFIAAGVTAARDCGGNSTG